MAEQFYTILTAIGKAKVANAAALGEKVELTHLALGDGNGSYYNPTEKQTELRNEVWRGAISNLTIDAENPNWIKVATSIPGQHGGFTIREAGVFDEDGDLIAIGKYPETYKPVAAMGSIKDLTINMILEVTNASSVQLTVNPTVILATQKQVDEAESRAKTYAAQKVSDIAGAGRTTETVKKNADDIAALEQALNNITPVSIGAETPAGAQQKANAAETAAKAYTNQEVASLAQEVDEHKANYATDKQKLDGIEDGAQKNPTAQQILNAIKTVDGVGSGLDADTVRGSVPYTPLNAPCVFGKYVGSGASSRLITLGFSPEAVLVIPSDGILFQNVSSTSYWGGLAFRNNPCTAGDNRIVTVGTSGFYVYVTEIGKYGGVFTNHENRTFYYVAWKG